MRHEVGDVGGRDGGSSRLVGGSSPLVLGATVLFVGRHGRSTDTCGLGSARSTSGRATNERALAASAAAARHCGAKRSVGSRRSGRVPGINGWGGNTASKCWRHESIRDVLCCRGLPPAYEEHGRCPRPSAAVIRAGLGSQPALFLRATTYSVTKQPCPGDAELCRENRTEKARK